MIYKEIFNFIEEKNPSDWKIESLVYSLKTEIEPSEQFKYESNRTRYLILLQSPYFYSFEAIDSDIRVIVLTFDSQAKTLTKTHTLMLKNYT